MKTLEEFEKFIINETKKARKERLEKYNLFMDYIKELLDIIFDENTIECLNSYNREFGTRFHVDTCSVIYEHCICIKYSFAKLSDHIAFNKTFMSIDRENKITSVIPGFSDDEICKFFDKEFKYFYNEFLQIPVLKLDSGYSDSKVYLIREIVKQINSDIYKMYSGNIKQFYFTEEKFLKSEYAMEFDETEENINKVCDIMRKYYEKLKDTPIL